MKLERLGAMLPVLAAVLLAAPAQADEDVKALAAEGKQVMMAFGDALKAELKTGMNNGGAINAIGVCNEKAPAIAARVSKDSGWTVSRSSHKLRNPDNAPDAVVGAVIEEFLARQADGEKAEDLVKTRIVEENGARTFVLVKAIPTAGLCLNCHGPDLKPEVAEKIESLYPADQARGFGLGDMRGVFYLRKPL